MNLLVSLAEGARFETLDVSEPIRSDLTQLFSSQLHTEEAGEADGPIKTNEI